MAIVFAVCGAASAQGAASGDDVRQALFEENFSIARSLLPAVDPEIARELVLVVDACELAAACDRALLLVERGRADEALALMDEVVKRMPVNLSGMVRARAVLALARAIPLPQESSDPELLRALDRALKAGEQGRATREADVQMRLAALDRAVAAAAQSGSDAQQALAQGKIGLAESAFSELDRQAQTVRSGLKEIEGLMEPVAFLALDRRLRGRVRELIVAASRTLGAYHLEHGHYIEAKVAVFKGLAEDPLDPALLELSGLVDETREIEAHPEQADD